MTDAGHADGYGPLPIGWRLTAEHINSDGERFGIASCFDHPQCSHNQMLVIWDDPRPHGSGIAAMALLDTGTREWLQEVLYQAPGNDCWTYHWSSRPPEPCNQCGQPRAKHRWEWVMANDRCGGGRLAEVRIEAGE
jgi:hypothetical protein